MNYTERHWQTLKNAAKRAVYDNQRTDAKTTIDIDTMRNPYVWSEAHRTLQGKPFRFVNKELGFRFQTWRPYLDEFPVIADPGCSKKRVLVYKCRKVAFTEVTLNALYYMLHKFSPCDLSYLLHNAKTAETISRQRIDVAILESILASFPRPTDNVLFKSFRIANILKSLSIGYTKSSDKKSGMSSTTRSAAIDGFYIDEIQSHDNIAQAVGVVEEAITPASGLKMIVAGGTPMQKGGPFDVMFFEDSDDKRFKVRCSCGEWTELYYPEDDTLASGGILILGRDSDSPYIACKHCNKNLEPMRGLLVDQKNAVDGMYSEWVAKNAEGKKRYSGYKFTPWVVNFKSTWELLNDINHWKKTEPQILHNEVLGESYSKSGYIPFPYDKMKELLVSDVSSEDFIKEYSFKHTYFGVDFGIPSYYEIWGDIEGYDIAVLLKCGYIAGDERKHGVKMVEIFHEYGCCGGIVDKGYSAGRFQDVLEAFPDSLACDYSKRSRPDMSARERHNIEIKRSSKTIYPNRNFIIEFASRKVHKGQNYCLVPALGMREKDEFIKHHVNIIPEPRVSTDNWQEIQTDDIKYGKNGPDHFGHCTVYSFLYREFILLRRDTEGHVSYIKE